MGGGEEDEVPQSLGFLPFELIKKKPAVRKEPEQAWGEGRGVSRGMRAQRFRGEHSPAGGEASRHSPARSLLPPRLPLGPDGPAAVCCDPKATPACTPSSQAQRLCTGLCLLPGVVPTWERLLITPSTARGGRGAEEAPCALSPLTGPLPGLGKASELLTNKVRSEAGRNPQAGAPSVCT